MKVLTVTNMLPTEDNPQFGIFVREQVDSIRRLGIEVDVLFMNSRAGRLRHKAYPLAVPRLWSRLRHASYDVVHAHYVFSGLVARCQWAAPLVITHHGIEVREPIQGELCRFTRYVADELIVQSAWMREPLRAPRAHVIPCGIDLSLFKPSSQAEARRELGLDMDRRYVLFAGEWWRPEKRFHLLEQAVARLQLTHPEIELLPIGREPHWRVPLYMNAADALVMLSTIEGGPLVVKEAMACGLPVLSTDVGDAWEVIGDTEGCYRITADVVDLANCLEKALLPPRRTAGAARVEQYSMDRTARRVVEVYSSACRRTCSRRWHTQTTADLPTVDAEPG